MLKLIIKPINMTAQDQLVEMQRVSIEALQNEVKRLNTVISEMENIAKQSKRLNPDFEKRIEDLNFKNRQLYGDRFTK